MRLFSFLHELLHRLAGADTEAEENRTLREIVKQQEDQVKYIRAERDLWMRRATEK